MSPQTSWLKIIVVGLAAILPFSQVSCTHSFEASCASLASKVDIPNVQVYFTAFVPKGTNLTFPDNNPTCSPKSQVVSANLCRLVMYVATSKVSGISLEAWLPQEWSGRFLSTGNGGLGGCIQYADLAYTTSLGFATVGANNGHNGTSGRPFLNAPEVIEDFAFRSLHTGVLVGKQLTKIFYEKDYTKSYYLGCSTGGREGQKSAQMFPNDFDGIVAGAPAMDFPDLNSWGLWLGSVTGFDNTSSSFVTQGLWTVVHEEILKQCDGIDGAVDGIIEDPNLCHPNFETLICPSAAANISTCLNGAQASRVRRVFEPFYGNGSLLYPRMQPGSELLAYRFYYNGIPLIFAADWLRYVVYSNPNWDPLSFTVQDALNAHAQDPFNISTFNGDLSPFRNAGGKLLTYHGLQDWLISSDNSERYYHRLAETMSLPPSDLDSFYRYFRVSGMGHCSGGPGAWNIGAFASGNQTKLGLDDNVLLRMVAWVEKGDSYAPEFIRGTKYVNDTVSMGVQFTRKHCKFPARNVYVGPMNYTDEDAWNCLVDQGFGN